MAKYIKTEEGYKRLEDVDGMIHLVDVGSVVLVDNLTYEAYNNGNYPKCTFIVGEKYDVIINGVTYENLTCYLRGEWRVIGSNDECPYYIDDDGGDNLYLDSSIETITIIQQSVKKIPKNYLPYNNVLLEGDAIPVPEFAEVGQTMIVSEVDENGKPTAWETIDTPTSTQIQITTWGADD